MSKSNFITIDEVNEQLNKGLEDIFKSERFNHLLNVMSKVPNYSFNNTLLIAAQKPDATMVQGFKGWTELGRYVNKGEKGIKILAPKIKKVEMEKIDSKTKKPVIDSSGQKITEKQSVVTGFSIAYVYDVSQTSGKEIPSVRDFINNELSNEDHIKRLYKDFFEYVKKDFSLTEAPTPSGVGGYYAPKTDEIVISNSENLNDSGKFSVLIHEYAHAQLHSLDSLLNGLPREHKEAQAESVAYIVSKYYGLETEDVSLGYIATWAQDINLARQAIDEVQRVSNQIILTIDELQKDKIQEFYLDSSKDYVQAKGLIEEHLNVKIDELDKSKITQLELLNKENGIVVSARVDYSEKNEVFQLRTDKNWIIPLHELGSKGEYQILKTELLNGKTSELYLNNNLREELMTSKLENGNFTIKFKGENVSKEFASSDLADKQLQRIILSESLHEQSFLKSQIKQENVDIGLQERLNNVSLQINFDVSKYLTHGNEQNFVPKGNDGSTIGWTLLKNKNISTIDDLNDYAFNKTLNLPVNNKLREAISNSEEISKPKKEKELVELER